MLSRHRARHSRSNGIWSHEECHARFWGHIPSNPEWNEFISIQNGVIGVPQLAKTRKRPPYYIKNIKRLLPRRSQRICAAFLEVKRNLELLSILI
jgi:hypothetical protein